MSDWQMYIVQEYCDGGSLFDAIQQRRFHDRPIKPLPSAADSAALQGTAEGAGSMLQAGVTGTEGTGGSGASAAVEAAMGERGQEEEEEQGPPGRVRLSNILAIASNIASGCAYIHSKNIIHGDLKVGSGGTGEGGREGVWEGKLAGEKRGEGRGREVDELTLCATQRVEPVATVAKLPQRSLACCINRQHSFRPHTLISHKNQVHGEGRFVSIITGTCMPLLVDLAPV